MFVTAVGIEHHKTHRQLEDDATHGPNVAGLIPTWEKYLSKNISDGKIFRIPSSMTTSGAL